MRVNTRISDMRVVMGDVLGQGEDAKVDGHSPSSHVLTVGGTSVVEAQDNVTLDCQINSGLDEDGEEV